MVFDKLRKNKGAQLVLGLCIGIGFGFCLQKGGVTQYDVIISQLLLTDFTVVKVMGTAVGVGMALFGISRHFGWVRAHIATRTYGTAVIGGLIFGVGFGLLGLCPGTVAGAIGQGAMDALLGGMVGMVIGAAIFAAWYPSLKGGLMSRWPIRHATVGEMLGIPGWAATVVMVVLIACVMYALAYLGL